MSTFSVGIMAVNIWEGEMKRVNLAKCYVKLWHGNSAKH